MKVRLMASMESQLNYAKLFLYEELHYCISKYVFGWMDIKICFKHIFKRGGQPP